MEGLYEEIYGEKTKAHWADRHAIPNNRVDCIHWKAQGKAIKRLPMGKHRWLVKHLAGQCAVGKVLARRKYQDHSNCPRCGEEEESASHVLTCPDMQANTKWSQLCEALLTWLVENDTQPDLCRALLQRIREWCTSQEHRPITGPRTLKRAIYEQDDIDWENFLMGSISQRFAVFQHNHFRHTGSKYYGRVWATRLITQLWELPWGMWEHRHDVLHNSTTRQQAEQLSNLRRQVRAQFCQGGRDITETDQYLLADKDKVLA